MRPNMLLVVQTLNKEINTHISDLSVCVSFSGTIYAQSSRMFTVNGHMLPYAWNHSITYDPIYGRMPYLVQRLQATDLDVEFDVSREVLQYQMGASIAKGKSTIIYIWQIY